MKKILIITYYWPPSGGGGVQRWLKFVKYLPEFGWEPIVFTPLNQSAPVIDESLLADVSPNTTIIRRPIWEPYNLYKKITGKKKDGNLGASFTSAGKSNKLVEKVSNWIRSNLFIPDARKFWIKPSVSYLKKFLLEKNISAIVTTGPPHSMHLIGMNLKRLTGIKWLADFRDPWIEIDYFDELLLSKWARKKHHQLERAVLSRADAITCVSESNKEKLSKTENKNIRVITNGFDETDMSFPLTTLDIKFTVVHLGTLMANRNPDILWEVLSELIDEREDFKNDFELHLVGKTDNFILKELESSNLMSNVLIREPVSHEQANKLQKKAQVLLLTVNKTGDTKGMVTGKVFEYMAANRPILAIGPEDGDLAKILKDTNSGKISNFSNKSALRKNLLNFYLQYKAGDLNTQSKNLKNYTRKNLTENLAEFLNKTIA